MKYYILSNNTHSNKGKVILAGPFVQELEANNTMLANGYKWGRTFIERLCNNIAEQIINKNK